MLILGLEAGGAFLRCRMASRACFTFGSSHSSSTFFGANACCKKRLMLLSSGALSHGFARLGSGGGSRSGSRGSLTPLRQLIGAGAADGGGAAGGAGGVEDAAGGGCGAEDVPGGAGGGGGGGGADECSAQ